MKTQGPKCPHCQKPVLKQGKPSGSEILQIRMFNCHWCKKVIAQHAVPGESKFKMGLPPDA